MTHLHFLCVGQASFSDIEKTGETDFFEKPKSILWHPLWGEYPKGEQVAMQLISGGRVTYYDICL